MTEIIVDSSVVLAILKNERSDAPLYSIFDGAVMSSVNVAEVYTKLSELKLVSATQVDRLLGTLDRIEPFTEKQARATGLLRERTSHAGLSLGDRACLALALDLGAEVYTADHVWGLVDVGVKIHMIR